VFLCGRSGAWYMCTFVCTPQHAQASDAGCSVVCFVLNVKGRVVPVCGKERGINPKVNKEEASTAEDVAMLARANQNETDC